MLRPQPAIPRENTCNILRWDKKMRRGVAAESVNVFIVRGRILPKLFGVRTRVLSALKCIRADEKLKDEQQHINAVVKLTNMPLWKGPKKNFYKFLYVVEVG